MFLTLHAAELAKVAPWDLEQQSLKWRSAILEKASIEADVAEVRRKRAERNRPKPRQGRR